MAEIVDKIKRAGLVGRGGACFPTWKKWQAVKEAAGNKKHVVCNAAEGEPGVVKDGYILEHYAEQVIDGMKIAREFLSSGQVEVKGYLYIKSSYYKKLSKNLINLIGRAPIELFVKPVNAGYIGGEECSVLNAIEGQRIEPRLRPPFPVARGLWQCPTLINNVETFYNVSLVAADHYQAKRFYSVNGACLKPGVYQLPDNWTIEHILAQTDNLPKFSFFVQAGGQASGEVYNSGQLKRAAGGAGSITIYNLAKFTPKAMIKNWLDFFVAESCGQCAPCREGVYRLKEIFLKERVDWLLVKELLDNLSETAFCGLGGAVPIPINSYLKNVLPVMSPAKLDLLPEEREVILKYFTNRN